MRLRQRGLSLIELTIVVGILAVVAAISIPNLLKARKNGGEAQTIGALKTVATAEAIFREGDKEQDENLDYGMLSELAKTELVDKTLGSGTKAGFLFEVTYSFETSEFLWFGLANPAVEQVTGDRYFCTNQAGVIFYTSAHIALDTLTCMLPNRGELAVGR